MADYIYLLRTRLTAAQQTTLEHVREAARAHSNTVFLVGGAVRDLTSGSPIRDLDVAVQGNALKLKKELQKAGGTLIGEHDASQALFFTFPGGVRLEVSSTLSVTYPKPGKPVYKPATILEDLRRRDFTANAMAISLNEGSFGLLMDPLNGVADIENRELRLVSNYGFIEDPSRMIRGTRLSARLGWRMEDKTYQRYENGKTEDYFAAVNPFQRSYELEEIFHEEDPLRVLRRLEAEGWAKLLFPAWTSAKVNETELERLRDTVGQLEAMGIHPDPSPAYFPLLTAKLAPKELDALKASFARPGFASQIAALDADAKALATLLTGKTTSAPSDAWKLIFASEPEPILWLAHTTKSAPLQARFKAFFSDWSQARSKIPYQLMQEMRILPELPGYEELLDKLFFAIMDGKLDTPEAAKAFLEPFSPPAPPPPVNLRRRAVKRETKAAKPRSKKAAAEVIADDEIDLTADVAEQPTPSAPPAPKPPIAKPAAAKAVQAKAVQAPSTKATPAKAAPAKAVAKPAPAKAPAKTTKKSAPAKSSAKPAPKSPAKAVSAKPTAVKTEAKSKPASAKGKPAAAKTVVKKAAPKPAPKKSAPPAKKATKPAPAKTASKSTAKPSPKSVVKSTSKGKPAAKSIAKPTAKSKPKGKR
jgi:tRNA nucleotidyltransferase/poly(A) polymerase